MGIAASFIAKLLARFHWISYLGLAIILFVALKMIYEGFMEVEPLITSSLM
jgi:predicted tellurium resistance membrane protein TerC